MERIASIGSARPRSLVGPALICTLLCAPLAAGCAALAGEKTACDGLVYKEGGLERQEFLPCAGEMMSVLDQLDTQIDDMLSGKEEARSDAGASVRKLGSLMRKAGGRNLLAEWDDRALNDLNLDISNAYSQHQACMMVARQLFSGGDDGRDAARSQCSAYQSSYEEARSAYRYLR